MPALSCSKLGGATRLTGYASSVSSSLAGGTIFTNLGELGSELWQISFNAYEEEEGYAGQELSDTEMV